MMRRRLTEMSSSGPFGTAPAGSKASAAAATQGGQFAEEVSEAEMSSAPMYMWDPAWNSYVTLGQDIVRGSLTGTLPESDKVRSVMIMMTHWQLRLSSEVNANFTCFSSILSCS